VFFHVCVKMFFLLTAVQKLSKSNESFQSYVHKCTATFFFMKQCILELSQLLRVSCLSCRCKMCIATYENNNNGNNANMFIASPAGAVAKYCDESLSRCVCVCVSVCLSVRQNISGTTRAIFTKFFVHVAYVRGSVLLWHVDDRPHRLSAGREGVTGVHRAGEA